MNKNKAHDNILDVFKSKGDSFTVADAYLKLIDLYSNSGAAYPKQKAAASLGGASNGRFIAMHNNMYIRIR